MLGVVNQLTNNLNIIGWIPCSFLQKTTFVTNIKSRNNVFLKMSLLIKKIRKMKMNIINQITTNLCTQPNINMMRKNQMRSCQECCKKKGN